MDVFSFDQRYFFHRQPGSDRWYASTHPALNRNDPAAFMHGYFRVSDSRYDGMSSGDGREFDQKKIREIETILKDHVGEMKLEQFDAYKEQPPHYKELGSKTNRYSDVFHRLRTSGCCDPDFAVALDQLIEEEPAYRLNRDFVRRVLERAGKVSATERDERLHEVLMDSWTYDVEPYAKRGETFEAFYKKCVNGLMFPKPMERRQDTEYKIYSIEGLPRIYMVAEEVAAPHFDPYRTLRHYLDRESAVVPLCLPHNCYVL